MPIDFDHEHLVRPEEIDALGHANNVSYFIWMQEAAVAHSSRQGWPTEAYQARGWAWLVRTHQIEYRRPALVGESIRIRTWVADMTRYTSRRKFEMYRGTSLIARAETNWAFVDLNQGRLLPIPLEVSSAFEIVSGKTESIKLYGSDRRESLEKSPCSPETGSNPGGTEEIPSPDFAGGAARNAGF